MLLGIEKIINLVKQKLIDEKIDEVWINPRSYGIGQRRFHEVRELIRPYGIRLEYIDGGIVDSHPWYFIREGEEDPTGWLKRKREVAPNGKLL